ncbi:hypothetical protein NW755_013744 [Fusarium falciforme]|uniref:FAD-binding PCMH-type domain-containing protein n=1 Tax=Fusarium falciforme TaxID=195108 RepID=A0A9W8UVI2_9HYPO|nr:hypothetical protein NW755_013744 [Fusarium falciforme]
MLFHRLSVLSLLSAVAWAAPSTTPTEDACEEISKALPKRVFFPISINYHSQQSDYWSTLLRGIKSACIVVPQSAEHVSTAVKILNKYPDVKFAVKSGGHDPNAGHATVSNGVLISLAELKGATYDRDNGVAYVKPGGEWNDVISELNKEGIAVVGGRLGIVGVGGLLLQGGISFLSAQYGLAADNIVGWEVVTANGTIVHVDAAKQPELAVAMRGSGSQFGVVTQFTIKTYPVNEVWGGIRIYDESKSDEIFEALHEFTPYNNQDNKAAIIVSNLYTLGAARSFFVFYFYHGQKPPTTGPFAKFLKIKTLVSTTKTQPYPKLLKANGFGVSLLNSRQSFRTITIPYVASHSGIYAEISDKMKSISKKYFSNPLNLASQCSVDFQPLTSIIGKHSEQRGGNAMGLTKNDPDRIILELQCSWTDKAQDDIVPQFTRDLTDWIETRIPEWLESDGQSADQYLPLFMNDAMADQNVTGSYKEYAKFKALQLKADPEGVLRTRVGGFKY